MTVQPLLASATSPSIIPPVSGARPVATLVTLGDSTAVGLGDPLPGGGWRGFPVLLRDALGASTLLNLGCTGARMSWVRDDQLPGALTARPDVVVLSVGMNDTLRSDFDPLQLRDDCCAIVGALRAEGAYVLMVRYHDHTRVFRLPAPLRRALYRRAVIDAVAVTDPAGIGVLDLDLLPGGYERSAWSVDRLHPSERGHRMLAAGFAGLLSAAGFAVPHPVSPECAGGREVTAMQRTAWLVVKGVPWLARRGRDLAPVIVQSMVGEVVRPPATVVIRRGPTPDC